MSSTDMGSVSDPKIESKTKQNKRRTCPLIHLQRRPVASVIQKEYIGTILHCLTSIKKKANFYIAPYVAGW